MLWARNGALRRLRSVQIATVKPNGSKFAKRLMGWIWAVGVVIVTDMFGGSPSNLSLSACNCANRRVLYGANLPLLVKLAKSRSQTVPEAISRAIDAGRKYMDCLPETQ